MSELAALRAKAARVQEFADRYYTENGPCCAGCDWWHHGSSIIGECRRSAPVAGEQRYAMLGIHGASLPLEAGHAITRRERHCGDFKDEFDWSSLSPLYLRRIGRAA